MSRYHERLESPGQVQSATEDLLQEIRGIGDIVYPQYIRITTTRSLLTSCVVADFCEREELDEWQHPVNSDVVDRMESATVVDIYTSDVMMKVNLMPFAAPTSYRGLWENLVGQSLPLLTPLSAVLWSDSRRSVADKMELSLKMLDPTHNSYIDVIDVDSTTRKSAEEALASFEDGVPLEWALQLITGSGSRSIKTLRWNSK